MNLLSMNVPDEIIHSLGWTLLHSFWQIALVTLVLGIILFMLKNASPAIRHNLAAGAMFLIFAVSIFTFLNEYSAYKPVANQSENSGIININSHYGYGIENETDSLTQFEKYIERNLSVIVIIWNVCIVFLMIRFLGGIFYSQQLRNKRIFQLPDMWHRILQTLSLSLGIGKKVTIVESALAKVPLVIGYFKPIILLPVGLLTGLSQEEAEAVIMHELAHIKRNDFILNLFISIIEIIFFFHPGIWWISKNIRIERENACDDLAISKNAGRNALAMALAKLELNRMREGYFALSFTGKNGVLIKRMKRMTTTEKQKFTLKEGILAVFLLIAGMVFMAFSSNRLFEKLNKQPDITGSEMIVDLDTNFRNNFNSMNPFYRPDVMFYSQMGRYMKDWNKKDTIITINPGNVVEYKVNGMVYDLDFDEKLNLEKLSVNKVQIPEKEWKNYGNTIHEVLKYLDNNSGYRKKKAIIDFLVEDMKRENLIKKDAISYKVHFYDNYFEINEVKQPDEIFLKYKKMFDEKSQGKYILDVKLNVNPNFYNKTPEEIEKMQQEILRQDKEKEEQFRQQQKQEQFKKQLIEEKKKQEYLIQEQKKEQYEQQKKKELLLKEKEEEMNKMEFLKQEEKQQQEKQEPDVKLKEQEELLKKIEIKLKELEVKKNQLEEERKSLEKEDKKSSEENAGNLEEDLKKKEEQLNKIYKELLLKREQLQKNIQELRMNE
jgi:bla regulator protein blaR1